MTELAFLLDLLLTHKLPMATKLVVSERIKEVEQRLSLPLPSRVAAPALPQNIPPHLAGQAPSTIAKMMQHPDLAASLAIPDPPPVAVIAQTPAAMAALNSRAEAIAAAQTGKIEKGRTSPRKF